MSATTAPMIVDNERPPIGEWDQIVARAPRLAATAPSPSEAGNDTAAARIDHDAVAHAAQLHRRLLGNGHCARPVELDCRFHTICEGCGFFQTGPEFIPILRRQRDDATAHGDDARTHLYKQLIDVIDDTHPDPAAPKDVSS